MTTGIFGRAIRAKERMQKREAAAIRVGQMKSAGYSFTDIAATLGVKESTVRNLLVKDISLKLRAKVDSEKIIDVGPGIETQYDVSRLEFDKAVAILRREGYELHRIWSNIDNEDEEDFRYQTYRRLAVPSMTSFEVLKIFKENQNA